MNHRLIIFFAFLILSSSLIAQNRVDRPIQVQLNFSGTFLKVFGNALTDSEVESLEVSKWALPGISAGYHFRKLLYFGYAYTPSRGLILKESWGFGSELDGRITVNHATGHLHNLEVRVSPFEVGFYGQAFFNYIPKVNYTMDFQRTAETVEIGENEYATDLVATWNFKTVNTVGVGFGYNWVSNKGISLNVGLVFPIITSPYYENIVITPKDPTVEISERDQQFASKSLENESFYFPIQINLNVGYNFKLKKETSIPPDRF